MVPIIRYPKCGGGHWLGNLIWHLQNANWQLTQHRTIFDGLPQGTVQIKHWFETAQDGSPNFCYYADYPKNRLFSTDCKFNMYLNFCVKSRFDYYHINLLPAAQQVLDLSDTARFTVTNSYFNQYYCRNIDLNYSWLFQDPDRFIDWIYNFMDEYNIQFIDNRNYVHSSIDNYKKTCANPADIINNTKSTIWLGWCHAVSMMENIAIDGQIDQQSDLESIATLLQPTYIKAIEIAEKNLFYWK